MLHVFISGQVQGVGFRRYIKSRAEGLNLTGWVKNLPDRRIEAVFKGDRENIEKMFEILRVGPFLADVTHLQVEEIEDQDFGTFDIIKD